MVPVQRWWIHYNLTHVESDTCIWTIQYAITTVAADKHYTVKLILPNAHYIKCPILPSVQTKISWLPKRLYNSYTGNQWSCSNLERKTDFGKCFFFFLLLLFMSLDDQMIPCMYIAKRIILKLLILYVLTFF